MSACRPHVWDLCVRRYVDFNFSSSVTAVDINSIDIFFFVRGSENDGHKNAGHKIDGPICRAWNTRTRKWQTKWQDMKVRDMISQDIEVQDMKLAQKRQTFEAVDWVDLALLLCSLLHLRFERLCILGP